MRALLNRLLARLIRWAATIDLDAPEVQRDIERARRRVELRARQARRERE